MRVTTKLLLSAAVGLMAWAGTAGAAELRQIGTISIPGEPLNSFDISYIDQATGMYFLADRSNKGIDIIDLKKGAWVGRVTGMVGFSGKNDTSGPNGVVIAGKEAWVGDGDSTVKVVDLKTMKIVDTIKTGGKNRADEIGYDPKDGVVAIANADDEPPVLNFISTKPGHKIIARLEQPSFSDGMEQTAYNPADGMFYTDIPEMDKDKSKGGLLVTNPKTGKQVKIIPVQGCAPHGIHIGTGGMVFLGCNAGNPRLGLPAKQAVIDIKTGKVTDIPDIGGSDESSGNNKLGQYYGALNGNPGGPVLAVIDAKTNKVLQKIPTGPGAHSVAAYEGNGRVYVPIAAKVGDMTGCGCITVYGEN